jgi:hypothetical protein
MMKRIMLALALTLLPGAAMAQHGEHSKNHAVAKAEHLNFAQELIAAKAELKLTDAQIKKLDEFSVQMDEYHKNMEAHHAKAESQAEAAKVASKLHTDLLDVFTEEQLLKVRPLMKAHMDKCEHMKSDAKKAEPHKH